MKQRDCIIDQKMILKQCVPRKGLPFVVEMQSCSQEVIEAMAEAKALSRDPSAKRYQSFCDALEDLNDRNEDIY